MKHKVIILSALLSLAVAGWFSLPLLANIGTEKLIVSPGNVAKGAYLARASGCIACHTSTKPGSKALAGGDPVVTPFGTFYAPNLTTDNQAGIGGWTMEEFAQALRKGLSPDGQPYYPAFPYSFYTQFSDQDVADLWAAFQTVPSVAEPAPVHELGFPFNLRKGLFVWQTLFFQEERFSEASEDKRYNRGAFLVESAAHCSACHTPRNLLGALKEDKAFTGSESMLEGEGRIPAITTEALKAAGWTQSDLAYALKSGIKHDGDVFGGSMSEVVKGGTAYLQPKDLEAIAYYLLNKG